MPKPVFKKGQSGNPKGRKKGVPNKVTTELKEMILQALHNKGGVKYLEAQAEKSPTAFLALVGKILPMQVTGGNGEAILLKISGVDLKDV